MTTEQPRFDDEDAVGLPIASNNGDAYDSEADVLDAARRVADEVLRPNAEAVDTADGPRKENFEALAAAGLLGLAVPRKYGGLDVSGTTQRNVTEILASACGATNFIQAQHHGPCRMIAACQSDLLKSTLLPRLATGELMCAISFAHLRRMGDPVLSAHRVDGGYLLNGTTPWVTGWGIMNQVVFGATLPDDRFVYVWVPADRDDFPQLFENITPFNGKWGTLEASQPLKLAVMNSTATVELTCTNLFVPDDYVLSFSDRETMQRNDRNGVLGAAAMPIGCAAGSIAVLCSLAEQRNIPAVKRSADKFTRELTDLRNAAYDFKTGVSGTQQDAIDLRARLIQFAMRAAHAAVAASSGAAIYTSNPAQRLLREAMFYTVQAQTREVMDSILVLLEHNS